ncbi:MAG: dienelactone hydrolase family protein [bacterium]|nr:dienelactone hydrolase family protein [bacterium]
MTGLVIITDLHGLRPLFDGHVARLQEEGFAAVACEPWWDEAPGHDLEERLAALARSDNRTMVDRVVAAADSTGCETVDVIGFCMGGNATMKAAASGRFRRAVSFYGMVSVPEDWAGPGDVPVTDIAADMCPTLAIFGALDPWIPLDQVHELEGAWAARPDCDVVVYPDADHGFVHDPERTTHRPGDAADAWNRTLQFLRA